MSTPVPGQPGETPEQRQARFAAASAVQARMDAQRRAEEQARVPVGMPMSPPERMLVGTTIPRAPTPQPVAGGLTQAAPFDVAAAYRQHSQKLADAIKAGQITVERARQLQAPLFAATKLGSTPEGQAAMNAAAAQAQGGMPMSGYDAAAQYRNFGQELMGMIKSGALTVEQANALKAPVFNAVKLGNSNAGYQQMQAALNAARQQMGGQNMGQSVNPVTPPPPMLQPPEREVIGQRSPIPGVHGGDTRIFAPTTPPPMPQPPMPVMPPPPVQGGGIGAFLGRPGEVPQGVGTPPVSEMLRKQMSEMLNPKPPQGSFVDTMPKLNMPQDPNFRFGQTPQQAPQNAQGMAMGGLLRKYYGGGMC